MATAHRRSALVIGVSEFPEGRLPNLPFAGGLVDQVTTALQMLGYRCRTINPRISSSAKIGDAVSAYLTRDDLQSDTRVVYVLTHGKLSAGEATVYALGSDGTPHPSADIAHWLTSVQNLPTQPRTLFLLDLCYAGTLARLPWQARVADDHARTWVLAATKGDQAAYDGRFSQALVNVLHGIGRGELDIDPTHAHVPLHTVARAVRREVNRLTALADGYPQQVTGSLIDISADADPPFFPNFAYAPDNPRSTLRAELDPGLVPFLDDLDEGLDARHFIERGAGMAAVSGPADLSDLVACFTGRQRELKKLAPWLNRVSPGSICVVTGSPGVGKSALLGVLVCAAHPRLREHTRPVWDRVAQAPYPIEDAFAAIHARQRGTAAVLTSMVRQLGIDSPPEPEKVIEAVRTLPVPAVVVIDALDEADDGPALVTEVLLPLARARREDGHPAARVLVGARRYDEYAPLRQAAEHDGFVIDLDDVDRRILEQDLNRYILDLLDATRQYRGHHHGAVRGAFAAEVAAVLAVPPAEAAQSRWGEFLVAGLYTRTFVTAHPAPVTDPALAKQFGAGAPRTLPEVLELDLTSQPAGERLRPVLAALAHTHGQGMPASVLARVTTVFGHPGPPLLSHVDLRAALEAGRFYLRQATDDDHTILYRLFHQGLTDYLRRHPHRPDWTVDQSQAVTFFERLLEPLGTAGARDWRGAEPYLMRHALQHAPDAARAGELFADPAFLLAADPAIVSAAAQTDQDRQVAGLQHASVTAATEWPEQRMALALNATRAGLADLAVRTANMPGQPPLPWQPQWTAGRPVGRAKPATCSQPEPAATTAPQELPLRFTQPTAAMACTVIDDRPVAVIAAGALFLVDLQERRELGTATEGMGEPPRAIACTEWDGAPVAVTIDHRDRIEVWDLRERQLMAGWQGTGTGTFLGLTCVPVDDRPLILVVRESGVQVWDLDSQELAGELNGGWPPVRDYGCAAVDGRQVVVVAQTSVIRIWDLHTLHLVGKVRCGWRAAMHVSCTILNQRPVAVTSGALGVLRLWDLQDRRRIGTSSQGLISDSALSCLDVDGRAVAVASFGRFLEVSDLEIRKLRRIEQPSPVTRMVPVTLPGSPAVVTAHHDGVVRINYLGTDAQRGGPGQEGVRRAEHRTEVLPLAAPRTAIDHQLSEIRHASCAVTAPGRLAVLIDADGRVCAADLATGTPRHTPLPGSGTAPAAIRTTTLAGRPVAVILGDSNRIFDLTSFRLTGTGQWSPSGPGAPVEHAVLRPEDGRVVTVRADEDGSLHQHDAATGDRLATMTGHRGRVTALAVVEVDNRVLAFSGGADATLRVWDLATLSQLDRIDMSGAVTGIEATPDGYLLVVANGEAVAFRHAAAAPGVEP